MQDPGIYFTTATGEGVALQDLSAADRATLAALRRREPARSIRRLLLHLVLVALGVTAILLTESLWVRVPAWFLLAGSMISGVALMHEGVHGHLVEGRSANRILAFLLAAPSVLSASSYWSVHRRHHASLRTEDDPDDTENVHVVPQWVLLAALGSIGTYIYLPHIAIDGLVLAHPRERLTILAEYAGIAALLGAAFVFAPGWTLVIWGVPFLIAAQLINVRFLAEHTLTSGHSPFTGTRTIPDGRFVSFWLCNVNYHLEHHLLPGVPWYNLPQAYGVLRPLYDRVGAPIHPTHLAFLRDWLRVMATGRIPRNVRLLSPPGVQALERLQDRSKSAS